jgi:outer membrane receptor for ferrienterochelin and colicins
MTSRSVLRRVLLAGAGICALHPAASWAQAVDYGTLEQVFGEPITTSVTGKPQRASEVPGDITIITQDDIRRSGATDIPTILQFVTGVDVRRYSFGDAEVAIRGYDSPINPRLLVLVNGRQVYLDDYGSVAWNTIPVQLAEIRQIEVIKGPASALFGFNAASGVINIVTYDPLLDNVNTATVRGGTQGYGEGEAVATEHIGKTAGVRISVGGWTATGFDDRMGATDPISSRYASVNIDSRWQITSNVLLSLEGGATDGRTPRLITAINDTQNRINFIRFGAAVDSKAGVVTLDVYRNQAINDWGYGGLLNNINDVFVAKLTDLLKLNSNNTIRIGLEYRNNGLAFELPNEGALSYNNFAANIMWDWQISPMFDLTNAVRVDHLELMNTGFFAPTPGRTRSLYDGTEITIPSFNSGLVIKATDLDTVRLTAARGLQVPSLFDFGLQIPLGYVNIVGTQSAQPTSVWDAELAYDRSIAALGATLTTAIYWQRNTDLLASAGSAGPTVVDGQVIEESENDGSSYELGLEVGLRGKTAGGMRWNISYRYAPIHDDITTLVQNSPTSIGSFDSGTPANEVIGGLGYTIDKWELDTMARYQSRFLDYSVTPTGVVPFTVDHYVVLNASVGYQVTKYLTLAGTAEQFDVPRVVETGSDYVNRQFIASATLKW